MDAILHKEWDKVDNLYRIVPQESHPRYIEYSAQNILQKREVKRKRTKKHRTEHLKKRAKNMGNKLGPGKTMRRARKWDCSVFEWR